MDVSLLAPVEHRDADQQVALNTIRSRDALVRARTQLINTARGLVKAIGGRLPTCAAEAFHRLAWSAVPSELSVSLKPMFESIAALSQQIRVLEVEIDRLATESYPRAQLLTQVPGVGNLTALTFLLTLGDPYRFRNSRSVGAFLGLAPGRRQSGDRDQPTRITKAGDTHLRWLLAQCANHITRRGSPDSDLKRHGAKLAKGGSKVAKRIAKVAVARKTQLSTLFLPTRRVG
jgi:transposase